MVKCKRCGSNKIVKNGMVRGKQRYLCKQCGCHFVEGDKRENKNSHFLKTICKLLQALNIKNYKTIGEYLNRDTAQVYRWMNEESFEHKCFCDGYISECHSIDKLFEELNQSGIKERKTSILISENAVDDLYVAVIMQRRKTD